MSCCPGRSPSADAAFRITGAALLGAVQSAVWRGDVPQRFPNYRRWPHRPFSALGTARASRGLIGGRIAISHDAPLNRGRSRPFTGLVFCGAKSAGLRYTLGRFVLPTRAAVLCP